MISTIVASVVVFDRSPLQTYPRVLTGGDEELPTSSDVLPMDRPNSFNTRKGRFDVGDRWWLSGRPPDTSASVKVILCLYDIVFGTNLSPERISKKVNNVYPLDDDPRNVGEDEMIGFSDTFEHVVDDDDDVLCSQTLDNISQHLISERQSGCNETDALVFNTSRVPKPSEGTLRVLSSNVCTLSPKESKDCAQTVSGRVNILEKLYCEAFCDIVCIQEGRSRSTGIVSGNSFVMYTSAADPLGNYGVQIWISFKHSKNIITSNVVSCSLMSMVINIESIDFIIISGHAPGEDAKASAKDAFYEALNAEVSSLRTTFPGAVTVIGIDSNAKLGSNVSQCVGRDNPDVENSNGSLLHMWCKSLHLCAINTFVGGVVLGRGLRGIPLE